MPDEVGILRHHLPDDHPEQTNRIASYVDVEGDDRLPSHFQPFDGLLIRALDRPQRQVLVDFEAFLARVPREQLNLGIEELLTGQEGKQLVPEQVGMDDLTQPGRFPVGLCQLIASPHDHQARRGMTASGLDAYAAVGRVVSSCQVSNLRRIS